MNGSYILGKYANSKGKSMDNAPMLTMMCGLPRSGKSTWIEKHKEDDVIVSPDQVRLKVFGVQFYSEVEQFVWGFTNGMANLLLEQKKDIIVDATNINNKQRQVWLNLASKYCNKVRIVWFKTPISVCKERNENSDSANKVPSEVIDRMARDFEDPLYPDPYLCDNNIWLRIDLLEFPYMTKTKEGSKNYYEI